MISLAPMELTLKKNKGILPTVFPYTNSPLGTSTPTQSRLKSFTGKNIFFRKPLQMHKIHYPNLFVSYRECFKINTGRKNPIVVDEDLSCIKQPTNSPLVFDSVKNKGFFPPLNSLLPTSFGTVEYDAHIKAKIEHSINHVFNSKNIQQLIELHHICELERTQLLTIFAMSVQNP